MMKIVSVLFASLFAAFFLFVGLTASTPYSPWYDFNSDGEIDIFDIVDIAGRYGTAGTPINTTYLLLDLQDRVKALENSTTGLPRADYYSPWISLDNGPPGLVLEHDLGTDKLLVYIQGLAIPDPPSLDYGVHQYAYGTREHPYGAQGAFWHNLTDTTITIYRCPEDQYWDYVRVWLWIIPFP